MQPPKKRRKDRKKAGRTKGGMKKENTPRCLTSTKSFKAQHNRHIQSLQKQHTLARKSNSAWSSQKNMKLMKSPTKKWLVYLTEGERTAFR